MAVTLQCPDSETLLRLFGQGGSREEMESLAQHVEQCTRCGEQIDEMLRKDELSLGLAQPVDGTDMPDSEALVNLRRRLEQLRPAAPSDKTTDAIGAHSTSASGSPFPATLPMSGDDHGITFLAPPQAPDEIGRLGPYRVLKKLGAGGMGMVLLAEDALLKRKVALKVMLPAVAVNPQARERFLREARAAAAIEHAHIITIHQVGEDNGVPFLAMPLLKGESLDDRLRREKKLPINEAVRITCEMADGLAAAHAQGLIHRDIKPGNVWLEDVPVRSPAAGVLAAPAACRPFKVKVLDFGLARSLNDEVHLTHSGAIVGTPAFMAPEQARGLTVDARADLFSLGCVLYVMLTGKRPFTGDSTMALLSSLALDTPKSPREVNPAVPAVLSDFTMRLLAKKPEERPASADAALDELRGLVRAAAAAKKAAPPSPHSAATKTLIQPAASRPDARPAKAAVRPPRRRVALLVGLALLFVIGGGFAAYQLLFKTNDGTLIVKVDDDADVRFRNGELHIMDADGKWLYTLKPSERNKTLPPGKYLIEVAGVGGLKMETEKFEIVRNGNATVRVTVAATKKDDTTVATKPTVDDAWIKQVRALPADKQVEAVAAKLKELNPGFDGKMTPWIEDGDVVGASADKAADISPVRALVLLRKFSCTGTSNQQRAPLHDLSPLKDLKLTELYSGNNQVSDLSPLKGMKLRILYCGCTKVSDLSPLKDMKLTDLDCQGLKVSDLSPLTGMPLRYLNCNYTLVYDLSPLKDMKLTYLKCDHTPVTDLSPLKGMPLKELTCDFDQKRDADILRSIKTLETINGKPAADFWKDVGAGAKPPADDAWVKQVRALQADKQLEAVVAKLKELNPGFDGTFSAEIPPIIDHGEVQFLWFAYTDSVTDITPLRALPRLENLAFGGSKEKWGRLADLLPLKDMKLKQLFLQWTVVSDLSPLKDMKLEILFLGATPVSDLSPLKDMKLTNLGIWDTKVSDLSPLKGMPLTELNCHNTQVSDLSPLKGMPLKNLYCDFKPERDAEILHSIKTLETINDKPAAEFWKEVDAAGKAAAKKDADPDRRAAEWVLSIGGMVSVNGQNYANIKSAADLPQTPFQLVAARLKENKQVSDAGLACFKDCKNLTAVDISYTQASDAGLASLKGCPNITHLYLGGTQVTNAGLADLKDWKKLLFLSLGWTSVNDAGLVHIKDCKNLEMLFFDHENVTDAGLALLNCETMTALSLNGTKVSDEGLALLKNNKIMFSLTLSNMKVSDAGLENLKGLRALKELDLTGSTVTAAGVKKLAAAVPKCKIKWDGDTIEPKQ